MKPSKLKARGLLMVETLTAIAILGIMTVLLVEAGLGYRRTAFESAGRQAAIWAADAQLKRIRAGAPLDSSPPQGLLSPDVTLQTTSQPGQGQWTGFELVIVRAEALLPNGRTVREQVKGYVRAEGRP